MFHIRIATAIIDTEKKERVLVEKSNLLENRFTYSNSHQRYWRTLSERAFNLVSYCDSVYFRRFALLENQVRDIEERRSERRRKRRRGSIEKERSIVRPKQQISTIENRSSSASVRRFSGGTTKKSRRNNSVAETKIIFNLTHFAADYITRTHVQIVQKHISREG